MRTLEGTILHAELGYALKRHLRRWGVTLGIRYREFTGIDVAKPITQVRADSIPACLLLSVRGRLDARAWSPW